MNIESKRSYQFTLHVTFVELNASEMRSKDRKTAYEQKQLEISWKIHSKFKNSVATRRFWPGMASEAIGAQNGNEIL